MKPNEIKFIDWIEYNTLFVFEHFLGYKPFCKLFGKCQGKLFKRIDSYLTGKEIKGSIEINEVDKDIPFEEFMKTCYQKRVPVVFRGAACEWGAIKKWSPDFFEYNYGNQKIILNDNVGLADQKFEVLSLADYVKQFKSRSLKYLRFSDIVSRNKELLEDFDLRWLRRFNLPLSWGEDVKMFMGIKGSLTPLHVGFSDFLFVQVMGQKKWIFYPTNNRLFLDARTERTLHYYSNANPYNVIDKNYPLLKYAQPFEVILNPGDVLWVPSLVWHHVENKSDSIGIRFGRSSLFSGLKSSIVFTILMFLFSTKPNLFIQALTRRIQKKDLQFAKSQKDL